jgi:protein-tyrosine phosphatase
VKAEDENADYGWWWYGHVDRVQCRARSRCYRGGDSDSAPSAGPYVLSLTLSQGDIDAAQDAEFLQLNGIVHIINCVPRHVPNLFQQSLGLDYVACDLDEVLERPFFDLKNRQFMGLVQLIERALEKTESVLVHSLNGINRSPGVLMGFLMVKYCWGVDKAYEFLLTKRADIKPHESYIDQLCLLEAQLQTCFGNRATEQQLYEWHPSLADPSTDEIVLVHTYLNTPSSANKVVAKKEPVKPPSTRRLSWIDQIPQMVRIAS